MASFDVPVAVLDMRTGIVQPCASATGQPIATTSPAGAGATLAWQ
jgi:hypothetical protein